MKIPRLKIVFADALKKWEVDSYQIGGQSAELYGEIRFYFTITNGVGRVEAPPAEEQHCHSKKYYQKKRLKKDDETRVS